MLPDTLVGVLLFVALLAPGFVYLELRERYHAGIKYSPIRETSLVVVTSLCTLAVSAGLFGVLRTIAPSITPDVGDYVRHGTAQFHEHYVEAALWGVAVLAIACLMAAMFAVPPRRLTAVASHLPRIGAPLSTWLGRRRGIAPIADESGWSTAFGRLPDTEQWLDVVLVDGTSLHGRLGSHSTQIEETGDRDLVLSMPIKVRPPNAEDWTSLDVGTLVVSAARISYLTVQYVANVGTVSRTG